MKRLVSDFDHTFYTLEYEQNIEAVQQFVQKGNQFMIATGRNLEQLLGDVMGYEIPISYYICNDGALIYDQDFKLLYRKDIEKEVVGPIFKEFDQSRYFQEAWLDTGNEYTIDCTLPTNKIVARPIGGKNSEMVFQKILKQYSEVDGYFSQNWLNIIDASVSKGNAIRFLQSQNQWLDEEIYTVGDSINDLSMNKMYQGYAIESGVSELKEISLETVSNIRELIQKIEDEKESK